MLIVGGAYAALLLQQVQYGIEFDEGFNLTVARNLATGHGYATTGIVPWQWSVPFDPNASTGPALIIPGALAWWVSDGSLWVLRLVPLTIFVLMVLALGSMFARNWGKWSGLIAAASPLVLSVGREDISTVSLVPGRYVGEFSATAFVVIMVWFADRRLFFLAGLAGGLAIQTKLNFALPVIVIWAVIIAFSARKATKRSWALVLPLGLLFPTLAFEFFRVLSVGVDGYLPNLKAQIVWLLGAVDNGSFLEHLESGGRRLGDLASTLSLGGALWIAVSIVGLAIWSFVGADQGVNGGKHRAGKNLPAEAEVRRPLEPSMSQFFVVAALFAASIAVLAWWGFAPPEKLPRIGLPGVLLGAPVLLVAGFRAWNGLYVVGRDRNWPLAGAVRAFGLLAIGLFLVSQALIASLNNFGARMLQEQVGASQILLEQRVGSLPMYWIWNLAEFQLLTGIPSETKPDAPAPSLEVLTSIRARTDTGFDDARKLEQANCSEVLYSSATVVICRPN